MARIPNRIRDLRKERKMSQVQLAELLGTTQSQVQKLESGDRRLTIEWMTRLARAFQGQIGDLFDQSSREFYNFDVAESAIGTAAERSSVLGNPTLKAIPFYNQPHSQDAGCATKRSTQYSVPAHPSQAGVKDTFAVRIMNDAMAPRYKIGETVYVIPGRPSLNDDMIIEWKDQRLTAAYFVHFNKSTGIVTYRLSAPDLVSVPDKEIKALYCIIGRGLPIDG